MKEEELKHRIKNALIVLSDPGSFKVGSLQLIRHASQELSVVGTTEVERITKPNALEQLEEIKEYYNYLLELSTEFSMFVSDKQLKFILCYNYGMGDLLVCSEVKGEISWGEDFFRS